MIFVCPIYLENILSMINLFSLTIAASALLPSLVLAGSGGGDSAPSSTAGNLKNSLRDNFCMDQNNGNTAVPLPLNMWDCNGGGSNQQIKLNRQTITIASGNLCIEYAGSGGAGAIVQQNSCNGSSPNQQWNFNAGDGSIRPQSDNNLCMDVTGNNNSNGATIMIFACNGGTNQKWTFT